MTTDYTTLKALAEAATPGPWEAIKHSAVIGGIEREYTRGIGKDQLFMACCVDDGNSGSQTANAAYIAAASPDVVLALIARVAELEKDAGRYQQILRTTRGDFDKMVRLAGMSQAHGGKPLHESLDEAIQAAKEQA